MSVFCPGVCVSSAWCVCVCGGACLSLCLACVSGIGVWELSTVSLCGVCALQSVGVVGNLLHRAVSESVCVCVVCVCMLGLRGLSPRSAGSCVSCGLRVCSVYVSHVRPVFSVGALVVRAASAEWD